METVRPNAFLLGASKCATTSIFSWFNRHPQVATPYPKEVMFFPRDIYSKHDFNDIMHKAYNGTVHAGAHRKDIILDATTLNLLIPYCVDRIKEYSGTDSKLIVCVREPIMRAYSHWWMTKSYRPGRDHNSFEDALKRNMDCFDPDKFKHEFDYMPYTDYKGGCYIPYYIEAGLYWRQIKRYKDAGFKNILVLNFEDIKSKPQSTYKIICNYLGIDEMKYVDFTPKYQAKDKNAYPDYINKDWLYANMDTVRMVYDQIYHRQNQYLFQDFLISDQSKWRPSSYV